MFFSPPTLHPPLITGHQDRDLVRSKMAALTAASRKELPDGSPPGRRSRFRSPP